MFIMFGLFAGIVIFWMIVGAIFIRCSSEKANVITSSENTVKPTGFWKRQFQMNATTKQTTFDTIFGIILPTICFFFDPIVFKGGMWGIGDAFLADYRAFAYILSFTSIMSLLAFLLFGKNLKLINVFFGGLFIVGAIISLVVGIVIFPFSLFGLIVLVGALGFTPLFAAFVFLRNGIRAFNSANVSLTKFVLIRCAILSGIFSLVIPYLINTKIQNSLEEMLNGDEVRIQTMGEKFKYIAPLVNTTALVQRYRFLEVSKNRAKKEAIAKLYEELSGEDIEETVNVIND